jgi:biotin transport system substrate-specific component
MSDVALPTASGSFSDRVEHTRVRFFRTRYENLAVDLALVAGFAAVTGLAAQVSFLTPWSPVPVTLQVFTVLLSGTVLGYRWGTASQALYVALGALLIPWYAPASGAPAFTAGGIAHLLGPTGGYLLMFPVAAFSVGYLSDRHVQARSPVAQVGAMLLGVGLIYAGGALGFWLVLRAAFPVVLAEAVLLFIPFDLAKGVAAGVLGSGLTPRSRFGPESDGSVGYRRWWPARR